jgi:hypothetical protein
MPDVKKDAAYYKADKERQAAVDKRGYYNEDDIRYAKQDPKMRHNFELQEKERAAKARATKRRGTKKR